MKKTLSLITLLLVAVACQDHVNPPETPNTTITAIMSATPTGNTTCNSSTGLANVVCLAEAFKATLDPTQLARVQLEYSLANAKRWSNLPEALYPTKRVGINLGSLNETQLVAFRAVMAAVLALGGHNEGYDELVGNLAADDYLNTHGGGPTYGAGNFFVAFLGIPSTTGLWELQYGGHHYTFANTYNDGQIKGVTPSFRGVEPMAPVPAGNRSYQPVEQERQAFSALLTNLSGNEQTTAKLSSVFTDILLGPGKDWQFPATKQGLRVGDLTAAKKDRVLEAIKLYVGDLDSETAATVLAKYTAELDDTYIAYSGTTTLSEEYDYIRVDGPSLWIEYTAQPGFVIKGVSHPHSVWRDRTGDYGGNK